MTHFASLYLLLECSFRTLIAFGRIGVFQLSFFARLCRNVVEQFSGHLGRSGANFAQSQKSSPIGTNERTRLH